MKSQLNLDENIKLASVTESRCVDFKRSTLNNRRQRRKAFDEEDFERYNPEMRVIGTSRRRPKISCSTARDRVPR